MYHKTVEHFIGRELTSTDIRFNQDENGNVIIDIWNLPEQKPTIKQLDTYYNNNKSEINKAHEIKMLNKKYLQQYVKYLFDQAKESHQPYQDELTVINNKYEV